MLCFEFSLFLCKAFKTSTTTNHKQRDNWQDTFGLLCIYGHILHIPLNITELCSAFAVYICVQSSPVLAADSEVHWRTEDVSFASVPFSIATESQVNLGTQRCGVKAGEHSVQVVQFIRGSLGDNQPAAVAQTV